MEFLEKCAKCCVYSIGGALFPRFCFVSSLSFQKKKKILREEAQQPGASKGMSVMYTLSVFAICISSILSNLKDLFVFIVLNLSFLYDRFAFILHFSVNILDRSRSCICKICHLKSF